MHPLRATPVRVTPLWSPPPVPQRAPVPRSPVTLPCAYPHPSPRGARHTGDSDTRVPAALKALESSSRRALQGLVFLVGNGLGLALALYKCQAMGLLPTRPSDWLAFVTPPQVRHLGSRHRGP